MNLKSLRKKAGLKQATAAAELGVTQSAVSQWESGVCRPRANLLSKMAQLYRCTADELLKAPNVIGPQDKNGGKHEIKGTTTETNGRKREDI